MAWIYLAASAESHSHSGDGSHLSPTVKTTDTLKASCLVEWMTDHCRLRLSGMTSQHSEDQCCRLESTSSMEAFPARTFQLQDAELAWMESEADLSAKSGDWLMSYDQASSSWKTSQPSLMEGWTEFSERWPSAGTMRDGYVYPQPQWARVIAEIGGGYLATPNTLDGNAPRSTSGMVKQFSGARKGRTKPANLREQVHQKCWPEMLPTVTINGNYNRKGASKKSGDGLAIAVQRLIPTPTSRDWKDGTAESCANVPVNGVLGRAVHTLKTPTRQDAKPGRPSWMDGPRHDLTDSFGGRLSPLFVEQMMGYNIAYTELSASVTQWFRKSQRKRSKG